jgi:hypothetical protein
MAIMFEVVRLLDGVDDGEEGIDVEDGEMVDREMVVKAGLVRTTELPGIAVDAG